MFIKNKKLVTSGIIFLLLITFSPQAKARELELNLTRHNAIQTDVAEVYKPSRLVMGSKTAFIIKAKPNSHVALSLALDKEGADILATTEGIVGEKGIIELEIELPEKKEIVKKIAYFEVKVWINEDLSDLNIARVVSADGKNTATNSLVIINKLSGKYLPGFNPGMPIGMGDINDTVESMQEPLDYGDDAYYYNKPLIIRNLRTPEVNDKNGK